MRLDFIFFAAVLLFDTVAGLLEPPHAVRIEAVAQENEDLFKRAGGGGGGGRGGGGGGGSRGGGGGSGGRTGSSSGGGSRGNTASSSNAGGTSRGGSGAPRGFGRGSYYGGGAAVPYRSGGPSPLGIAAIGFSAAVLLWPSPWLHGAYLYYYPHSFTFHNDSTSNNETLPVVCGCGMYQVCGCDENNTTMRELVGNGSYEALNKSVIDIGYNQSQKTLLLNGTLPNGTTADGADSCGVALGMKSLVWAVLACAFAAIFFA
ncbi:uncharacterized protein MAM_07629 [Metarhizium album ARSEF 1941]|uniref:DUF7732 domain-containing protein n=1 Tax=Metarhizium album (strain ARSEF 1941) TaxID=1081103 RepID=A0A0B2WLL1_METAS|nr:uncharacterized protein MAM_07629 [Metarhizium album ARSEF 1941]KHN94574.1 hypothetical protein MAM_07629 [Metarhizium album ARSEF 1941]